ncbi:MAG: hypothetical protein INF11_13920 [Methylobacterium sp.]|nr:hypothetical protein [Methylobacterium sp.]MCA3673014.1 hypothetical protein [Methylobacterium sp.]
MLAHIPDEVTIAIYPPPQEGMPFLMLFSMPKDNIHEVQVFKTKAEAETAFQGLVTKIARQAEKMGLTRPGEFIP